MIPVIFGDGREIDGPCYCNKGFKIGYGEIEEAKLGRDRCIFYNFRVYTIGLVVIGPETQIDI